jgi:hypothetical protein
MSPQKKIALRRIATRDEARLLLEAVVTGKMDTYAGFRQLYGLWLSNNAAVQELRPLFRIPGVEADGTFSVTSEFREIVRELSIEILPLFRS